MRRPRSLNSALEILRGEEAGLARRLQLLKAEQHAVLLSLKRVRGGLAALDGGEQPATQDEPAVTDGSPPKAHLSAPEILQFVREALQGGQPKPETELKGEVLARLKNLGRAGTGLHLVLRQVLSDASLRLGPRGYELQAPHAG